MIKIGQIGIGHNHAEGKMQTVRKMKNLFEVTGYAEEDEQWINKRAHLDCYNGLERMSVGEVIEKSDAVLIESDVWNLTAYAKMCVDKGKHVHIDKPVGGDLKEYEELLKAAQEQGLVVQTAYMYRYNPAVKKCMELIKNGTLGEIYSINAEMSTRHCSDFREWLNNFKGGSMYIFGCHLIDLAISVMGRPLGYKSYIKRTKVDGVDAEDNCFAVLEYEKGFAKITASSVECNGWGRRQFVVCGSKGTVEIKPIERPTVMTLSTVDMIKEYRENYFDHKQIIEVPQLRDDERYDEMLEDFAEFINGLKKNPYDYEYEYLLQQTINKINEI